MTVERLEELEKKILIYDKAYFNYELELISDEDYDKLVMEYRELLRLFPEHESVLSPGFVSAEEKNGDDLFPITEPMLSIAKFTNLDKFMGLMKRYKEYTIEEKLDGVAVRLVYDANGFLAAMHLRGNGYEGKEISACETMISGITKCIEEIHPNGFTITGEVTCTLENFDKYIATLEKSETPCRNVVSGMLRRNDIDADTYVELELQFIPYHASKVIRDKVKTYPKLREWFLDNNFEVPEKFILPPEKKPDSIYPIDGIVIKKDDLSHWDEQSFTGYYSYAGCFKYPTDVYETTVTGVTWNVDLKGYINAVLNFVPVKIAGSLVSKCTFHYVNVYIKNGIRIGSKIKVTKGNEIIPKLIGLVEQGDGKRIEYPSHCPCCGERLTEESSGVYHCDNEHCKGQISAIFRRAVSDTGLNIKGMGEVLIETLVESDTITSLSQLFSLTVEDLKEAGKPLKLSKGIIKQITESTKLSLAKWLFAAGIPGLGETRALVLEEHLKENDYNSPEKVLTCLTSKEMTSLFGVDGLTIISYCNTSYQELLNFFSNLNFEISFSKKTSGIPVCITGKSLLERKILKEILLEKGYWLDNKVTKNTYKLLAGENPSEGKLGLAIRYDIPVIHIKDLGVGEIIAQLEK